MKKLLKNKFIVIMSCFIIMTIILTFFSKTIYYSRLPLVTVTVPSGGKLLNTIEMNSLVEHYHTNQFFSRQEGYVKEIYVEEGEQVTAGQVIMDFEVNREVLYQLEEEKQKKEQEIALLKLELNKERNIAPQEISSLEKKALQLEEELNELILVREALNTSTYQSAELDAHYLELTYGRMVYENACKQFFDGKGSQAEVDNAIYLANKAKFEYEEYLKSLIEENEKDIKEIEAQLDAVRQESAGAGYDTGYSKKNLEFMIANAELALQRMEENLTAINHNQLVAGADGVIAAIHVGQGSFVGQNTLLYELAGNNKDYKTTIIVPEESLKFVVPGQEAVVEIGGYKDTVKGMIEEIEPYGDGSGQYRAVITLKDLDENVAGRMASITITHTSKEYEQIVPRSAVMKDDKGYYVMVLRKNDTIIGEGYLALKVSVELIDSDDSLCAISGMFIIEPVIITSTREVSSGQQVRYIP